MDIEVSLLQVNVEKIKFGTCRNSQGKCYHDSSAAQCSAGSSLTQPTTAEVQSSLTQADEILLPNPDSSPKFN